MKKLIFVISIAFLALSVEAQWDPNNTSIEGNTYRNGNVGIGTSDPGSKLNVGTRTTNSPSAITQFGDYQPNGEARALSLVNSGGGSDQSTSIDFHNNSVWSPTGKIQVQQISTYTQSKIHFYTYNSGLKNRMTIDHLGYVGIGTTSPKEAFQIGDIWTFHNGGHKIIGYNYDYNSGDKRIVDNESAAIRFTDAGDIRILTSGFDVAGSTIGWSNSLIIKNDGNIGIGTTDPQAPLHSVGNYSMKQLRLERTGGNVGFCDLGGSNGDFRVWAGGYDLGHRFVIKSSTGYVGIGVDDPKSELAVNGQIRAKEVKVLANVNVPDYVFEEGYKLRTLKETKEYISENKHLPEIPSASEIGEDGIDLGDMNMRLLKKIEELTLHMIRIDEELQGVKAENAELKKKMSAE